MRHPYHGMIIGISMAASPRSMGARLPALLALAAAAFGCASTSAPRPVSEAVDGLRPGAAVEVRFRAPQRTVLTREASGDSQPRVQVVALVGRVERVDAEGLTLQLASLQEQGRRAETFPRAASAPWLARVSRAAQAEATIVEISRNPTQVGAGVTVVVLLLVGAVVFAIRAMSSAKN